MDTTQILLTIVLTITTILLIVIGLQLIFILKDFRRILKRINNIIDQTEKIGTSFEQGFSELTGFLSGMKLIFRFINSLKTKKK